MGLLSVEEALKRVISGLMPLAAETVQLEQAHNRILAENLVSKVTQPPFSASAMDGYAVKGRDVATAPIMLTVIGEAAAGHGFTGNLAEGQAVRIFTGAPLPSGADTVVIQEETRANGQKVEILNTSQPASYVRPRGFDFSEGETLLTEGTPMTARALALAAAMNITSLQVRRKPKVAILATGDELVAPGENPNPDRIISSIPHGISAMTAWAGGTAQRMGIAKDNIGDLTRLMDEARHADILLTIGGASVGKHDLVQTALKQLGLTLGFWKIAMRPGKPLMFGKLEERRVLGVPGNPVSALICSRIFLVPMIRGLLGLPRTDDNLQPATLSSPLPSNGPRQHYMRGISSCALQGGTEVAVQEEQDSSLLAKLAGANCLIVRDPHAGQARVGDQVMILPLDF